MSSDTDPEQRATAYSYEKAAERCVSDHMKPQIRTIPGANGATSPSQGDKGLKAGDIGSKYEYEWFDDGNAWGTVYPPGAQDCYQIMQKLITYSKLQGKDVLSLMGYTFDSSIPAWKEPKGGASARLSGFKSFVSSQLGDLGKLNDNASKYLLYLGAFTSSKLGSCNAKKTVKYADADATQKKWADKNSNGYVKLTIVNGTTPEAWIYTFASSTSSTSGTTGVDGGVAIPIEMDNWGTIWNYRGDSTGGNGEQYKCSDLIKKINDTAAAYAAWLKTHGQQATTPGNSADPCAKGGPDCTAETKSSCAIEGIGWILCPVLTAGAGIADSAYRFLADAFLKIDTSLVGADTQTAWKVVQGVANVLFALVFLWMIYLMLTSSGNSNRLAEFRRMFLRLVIMVVLANVSFFICQIAVDLSNILGFSLKEAFGAVAKTITAAVPDTTVTGNDSTNIAGIVAAVLIVGSAAWINIGAVLVALIGALVSLLVIFFMLALRQALVVLLVVVAPIAFVAYVLPNTQGLFDKWRKMFTGLLLVFPSVGLVYGACLVAHAILWNVAQSPNVGDNKTIFEVIAYIALVVPLIVTIPLLKASVSAAGNVGATMNAIRGKLAGTAQSGAKAAGAAYKNSDWNKFRSGIKAERSARIRAGEYGGRGGRFNPRNWASSVNAGINSSAAFDKVTGGYGTRRGKSAAKWEGKEIAEKAETLAGRLDANGLPIDPETLFDEAVTDHLKVRANPNATEAERRDARIGLAAAQAHLVRSNGQAGSEYAREQIARARGGSVPPRSSTTAGPLNPQAPGVEEVMASWAAQDAEDERYAAERSAQIEEWNRHNPDNPLSNPFRIGRSEPRDSTKAPSSATPTTAPGNSAEQTGASSAAQRAHEAAARAAQGTAGDGIFTVQHSGDVTHTSKPASPAPIPETEERVRHAGEGTGE